MAGGRIRKTETTVFEIRRKFGLLRPAGGCGRNAGRKFFWFFGELAKNLKIESLKIHQNF